MVAPDEADEHVELPDRSVNLKMIYDVKYEMPY